MIHEPQEIAIKAVEVRQLLTLAVAALDDPEALQAAATFAKEHPEVEWEPVAIAAAALNFKRDLDDARGVPPGPALPGAVVLPLPRSSAGGTDPGVSLPLPKWGRFW